MGRRDEEVEPTLAGGRVSSNSMTPPAIMMEVLMCPTTLYVRLEVAPMTRKVERLTARPRRALMAMVAMAAGV